ncbi:MAG: protein-glutamate O-methyltransferase CheR [Proteobacteria bacterium]|nr:protein-glutamate O-methyltransferase CheR [Pseudomonadota bacterium]MBU4288824.1 protein-glutamate O-methyltransferase CheR [Pseudomonadota bacterium]MBU4415477.1 protein-glutamate O-methyltransferase CheR [Pseudomonadota bacterium]MCG2757446.1 protein-glutamate O-methyltransferase CheR [Desulfobacteraceae bacterium]
MMNHQFNDSKYLELIFKGLHEKYGVDFSLYRESTIKRRLARRMAATDSDNYLDYFYTLEKEPGEYENLLRTLTIKVSRFFRNQHLFQTLYDDIFPDIINAKIINNDNTLRIWGAGCAFGEEIYSVTITLLEYLKKKRKSIDDYDISIFGTDIDGQALNKAKLGIYDKDAVKDVKKEILDKYFIRRGDLFQLIDSIKNLVYFTRDDLTSEKHISPSSGVITNYDLILCRNTLIYFSQALQQRVFLNFIRSLNPGGYLVLGKSESIPGDLKDYFILTHIKDKIYKFRDRGAVVSG